MKARLKATAVCRTHKNYFIAQSRAKPNLKPPRNAKIQNRMQKIQAKIHKKHTQEFAVTKQAKSPKYKPLKFNGILKISHFSWRHSIIAIYKPLQLALIRPHKHIKALFVLAFEG